MERFKSALTLTTTESATLLGVHPSTVKRWTNEGTLAAESTEGGHRRIHLGEVVRFSQQQGIRTVLTPFPPYEAHVWTVLRAAEDEGSFREAHTLALGWIALGETRRLELLYQMLGRSRRIDFCTFCDLGIRGLMTLVGDAWRDGRLRVGEEHAVTQTMTDVLLRLRADWLEEQEDPYPGPDAEGRVAIVGTLEGNHHHLGALCVRLLLERAGWRVHYLGPDVPAADFQTLQRGHAADLVCISLGPVSTYGDIVRCVGTLAAGYDRSRPFDLVLGGSPTGEPTDDALRGPFRSLRLLDSCAALAPLVHDQTTPSVERK